jgi:hypothetical protein
LKGGLGLLQSVTACAQVVQVDFWPSEASLRVADVELDKALPAILAEILPMSLFQGAKILSKHSQLRRWLWRAAPAINEDFFLASETEDTYKVVEHHRKYMTPCAALLYVDDTLNETPAKSAAPGMGSFWPHASSLPMNFARTASGRFAGHVCTTIAAGMDVMEIRSRKK